MPWIDDDGFHGQAWGTPLGSAGTGGCGGGGGAVPCDPAPKNTSIVIRVPSRIDSASQRPAAIRTAGPRSIATVLASSPAWIVWTRPCDWNGAIVRSIRSASKRTDGPAWLPAAPDAACAGDRIQRDARLIAAGVMPYDDARRTNGVLQHQTRGLAQLERHIRDDRQRAADQFDGDVPARANLDRRRGQGPRRPLIDASAWFCDRTMVLPFSKSERRATVSSRTVRPKIAARSSNATSSVSPLITVGMVRVLLAATSSGEERGERSGRRPRSRRTSQALRAATSGEKTASQSS